MKQATIRSVCECQSGLEAVVDEQRYVLAGFAIGAFDGIRERAPAHSIDAAEARFDVAWLCPVCGRNTLRSFDRGGLSYRDAEPPAPGVQPPPQLLAVPGPGPSTPGLRLAAAQPPASRAPATLATPSAPSVPPARPSSPASVPPARPSSPPAGSSPSASQVATAVALKSMSVAHKPTQSSRPPGMTLPSRPAEAPPPSIPLVPPSRPSAAPAAAPPPASAAPPASTGIPPTRPSVAPPEPAAPPNRPSSPPAPLPPSRDKE